ncbi:hypothetical protein FOA52_014540 [Chlamydomonas sp. UWO 241]|nr:hypothetical protein FOA52_014540 [Chlamydomonas sp. UWO 241]
MKVLTVGPEVKDAGSKPFTLGLGAGLTDGMKEPFLAVNAKKSLSLLDGPNTVVSAKAEVDVSHTGGETLRSCLSLKLSHKVMNFTKRQDLKFTVGCDVENLSSGAPKATPRLHLHENNWAAHYRWNKLFFTYDL